MTEEQLNKGNKLKIKIEKHHLKVDDINAINADRNNLRELRIQAVYNDKYNSYREYSLEDKNIAEQILAILSSHENETLLKLEEEFEKL